MEMRIESIACNCAIAMVYIVDVGAREASKAQRGGVQIVECGTYRSSWS